MDEQLLEAAQSIALSLKGIAKRIESLAVSIGSIAESTKRLESVACSLSALGETSEILISAGIKQNRRIEGLLGDLIDIGAAPQVTHVSRDRSGKVVSSTRTIDTPSDG